MPRIDFRPEQRLGPYVLVREIGRGGFASVWLARRQGPGGFESRVAIKLIRIEFRTDPSFQKMFIDEAKLAAAIHHPNVVSIFELGEVDDVLYLVMEYIPGRPLSILRNAMTVAGKTMPAGIVMRIIADTCAGLHAAHELSREGKPLGVIHRDVSPQNILVSDKGIVKLIDFGVAKANERLAADTTDGHTKGKLRYMAPEQALAREVDRRADIWAAGAVAFDLLEGHAPFDGHNDLARLFKLMATSPAPAFTTNVPAPIAAVIYKALEHEARGRWSTAAEMRAAIEAAMDECGIRVTSDDVVEFFGNALTAEAENEAESRSNDHLHARLRRPSAEASQATADIEVEYGAVADVPGVRRSRVLLALMAAGILLAATLVFALRWSRSAAESVAEQGPPLASPEPHADRHILPAVSLEVRPPLALPTATEVRAAVSSPPASPDVRSNRTKGLHPRAKSSPPAATLPSARPRYDDTIQ